MNVHKLITAVTGDRDIRITVQEIKHHRDGWTTEDLAIYIYEGGRDEPKVAHHCRNDGTTIEEALKAAMAKLDAE